MHCLKAAGAIAASTAGRCDPAELERCQQQNGRLLDVDPELLRHLGAGQRLRTADLRQRRAESLRGEKAHPLLLHGGRDFLSRRLAGGLAEGFPRLFLLNFYDSRRGRVILSACLPAR